MCPTQGFCAGHLVPRAAMWALSPHSRGRAWDCPPRGGTCPLPQLAVRPPTFQHNPDGAGVSGALSWQCGDPGQSVTPQPVLALQNPEGMAPAPPQEPAARWVGTRVPLVLHLVSPREAASIPCCFVINTPKRSGLTQQPPCSRWRLGDSLLVSPGTTPVFSRQTCREAGRASASRAAGWLGEAVPVSACSVQCIRRGQAGRAHRRRGPVSTLRPRGTPWEGHRAVGTET